MRLQRDIAVSGKYDVIVCGCGVAGFTAAVAAARAGCKVCIIEESGMPGGVLTSGGNNHIGLFNKGGTPIIRGIGWEFVQRLAQAGHAKIPVFKDGIRHSAQNVEVNIVMAAHMMDTMLAECGVDIKYTYKLCDALYEDEIVKAAVVATKTGLLALQADYFIDATGDGDLSYFSGCKYELSDELQPGTLRFFPLGFDLTKMSRETVESDFVRRIGSGEMQRQDNWTYTGSFKAFAEYGNNFNHIAINSADSASRSAAEIAARKSLARVYEWMRSQKGAENMEMITCCPNVAARESRRILGNTYITTEDYVNGKKYTDSVCYSYYPVDLHKFSEESLENIYIAEGVLPSIPLSALCVRGKTNLLTAGRCVGGDRLANSAYRVKASCMAMGHAAGAAAAVAVFAGKSKRKAEIDFSAVKKLLTAQSAIVPEI